MSDEPTGWDRVWHSCGQVIHPAPPDLAHAALLFEYDPNSREAHQLCAPYRQLMSWDGMG